MPSPNAEGAEGGGNQGGTHEGGNQAPPSNSNRKWGAWLPLPIYSRRRRAPQNGVPETPETRDNDCNGANEDRALLRAEGLNGGVGATPGGATPGGSLKTNDLTGICEVSEASEAGTIFPRVGCVYKLAPHISRVEGLPFAPRRSRLAVLLVFPCTCPSICLWLMPSISIGGQGNGRFVPIVFPHFT